MREYLVAVFSTTLLTVQPGWAQEIGADPTTKISQFVSRDSHLLSLDVYPLGNLVGFHGGNAELSAVVATDVKDKTVTKGLRVLVSQSSPTERGITAWCDVEELLDLSWSIGYLFGEAQKPKGAMAYSGGGTIQLAPYRALAYSTKGGLRLRVAPDKSQQGEPLGFSIEAGTTATVTTVGGVANLVQMKTMVDEAIRILR